MHLTNSTYLTYDRTLVVADQFAAAVGEAEWAASETGAVPLAATGGRAFELSLVILGEGSKGLGANGSNFSGNRLVSNRMALARPTNSRLTAPTSQTLRQQPQSTH